MNPYAIITMENGNKIEIELLPKYAPNTVNSFLHAAQKGVFDNHTIDRIIPDKFVDASCTGFRCREGQYLIPYESKLNPELEVLDSAFGCVCMGGYGELGQAGCEFFFPLKPFPEHKGTYPVFGKIRAGEGEITRLAQVELLEVKDFPYPEVQVFRPVVPQKIMKVDIIWNDYVYSEPVKLEVEELPLCWKQEG